MFVNIASPTQLQDGTTYDSINIIYHNYMKSTKNDSSISIHFSLTGYEKYRHTFNISKEVSSEIEKIFLKSNCNFKDCRI